MLLTLQALKYSSVQVCVLIYPRLTNFKIEKMKKFVKIELGSRGEVEELELVETSYELIEKEFSEKLESLKEGEDEEYLDYLEEFGSIEIDFDKGEVMFGFSEEDCTFFVEVEKNEDLCGRLLKHWDSDEDMSVEFYELIGGLGC